MFRHSPAVSAATPESPAICPGTLRFLIYFPCAFATPNFSALLFQLCKNPFRFFPTAKFPVAAERLFQIMCGIGLVTGTQVSHRQVVLDSRIIRRCTQRLLDHGQRAL